MVVKCWNQRKHNRQWHDVYALSRGKNAGKPLTEPCPNCFVVRLANKESADVVRSLLLALWLARSFEPYLYGSVVEYLRIDDFTEILSKALERQRLNPESFKQKTSAVVSAVVAENRAMEQLKLIKELKRVTARNLLTLGA